MTSMLSENQSLARRLVQSAWQAMQQGNRSAARRQAEQAASLAPDLEDVWIMLAALAKPQAASAYLRRALQINPSSQRAKNGLRWVEKQLNPSRKTKPTQIGWPLFWLTGFVLVFLGMVAGAGLWLMNWNELSSRAQLAAVSSSVELAPTQAVSALEPVLVLPVFQPESQPTPLPILVAYQPAVVIENPLPVATLIPESALAITVVESIPAAAVSPEPAELIINQPQDGRYTVQAGDTPAALARQFGVGLPELLSINQLNFSSVIYPGQSLIIPDAGYVAEPLPETASPVLTSKYILVDISEQHLYAYENGNLIYSFVASTGMNNATLTGNFAVQSKIPNAYGATWNIWMPNWLGIYWAGSLENGIHALPILPGGGRLWAGYLGTPISYGCVVLGEYESSLLFQWAEIGTPVDIQW